MSLFLQNFRAPDGLVHVSAGSLGGHSLMRCEDVHERTMLWEPARFEATCDFITCLTCLANIEGKKKRG